VSLLVTIPDPDTATLIAAAAGGDQHAWDSLVDRYAGLVWTVARSFRLSAADAADVSQTTWLRLVEQLGRIRQPDRLGAWLATTARRESLAVLNRASRDLPTSDPLLLEPRQPTTGSVDEDILRAERDSDLWRAFESLPANCQQLLRLLMVEPTPGYAEVSAALAIPIGSIGPTRARCLGHLKRRVST
jgi:RNA polymerase sigma factor (sigma-70 family)